MTHPVEFTIRNGTKVYPGTVALDDVDFDVHMGAVNVLVGENGAGKSTMMKVLAGVEQLTSGKVLKNGEEIIYRGITEAAQHGIGIVFQELNLFPNMSVAENIFMAREKTRFGIDIDKDSQREFTRSLMERLEHDISPDTLVGSLRIGEQQIIEIAKSLAQDARVLILDEPTSALSSVEVEILFRVIAELTAQGVGIIYISHRLEELIRIGDYITVLRDGKITGSRSMKGVDIPWIVRNMIGGTSKNFAEAIDHDFGEEVFKAEGITLPREGGGFTVDHMDISLKKGEILGIYGLMGAGRTEFFECIMAQHPHSGGKFFVEGKPLTEPTVEGRIKRGIALIPEDRKALGLIDTMSIRENITLSSLSRFTRWFHMNLVKEKNTALQFIKDLTIKIASPENPIGSLSGGNQQKVVIGKALMTTPKILLMDEPSRGIDIGAKAEVFQVMRKLASDGLGILFVTSDLDEVMSLSDRIIVMSNGRITGEWDQKDAEESMLVDASAIGHTEHLNNSDRETLQ